MNCPKCPCPVDCTREIAYCRWAAKDPQEPIEIRAICEQSRIKRQNGSRITSNAFPTMDEADRLIAQAEAAMGAYDPRKGSCCG